MMSGQRGLALPSSWAMRASMTSTLLGLDGQDAVVRVDDVDVELEPLAVDLDHLEQERNLRLGSRPAGLLHRFLQDLDARLPALGLLVDAARARAWAPTSRARFPPASSTRRCPSRSTGARRLAPPMPGAQLGGKVLKGAVRGRIHAHVFLRNEWDQTLEPKPSGHRLPPKMG